MNDNHKRGDETVNAGQMHNRLTEIEVDGKYAPDCRRVLRGERESLAAAMQSGDAAAIKAAMDEARRVAKMWSVEI